MALDEMVDEAVARADWQVEAARQQQILIDQAGEDAQRVKVARAAAAALRERWQPPARPTPPAGADDIVAIRRMFAEAARKAWTDWQSAETGRFQRLVREAGAILPPLVSAAAMSAGVDADTRTAFAEALSMSMKFRAQYPGFFSGYRQKFEAEIASASDRAGTLTDRRIRAAAEARMTVIGAALDKAGAAARHRRADAEASLAAARHAGQVARQDAEEADRVRTEQLRIMAEHVEVAGDFPRSLETEYRARHDELIRAVEEADDEVERLAAAMAVLDAARTYDDIRSGERG